MGAQGKSGTCVYILVIDEHLFPVLPVHSPTYWSLLKSYETQLTHEAIIETIF